METSLLHHSAVESAKHSYPDEEVGSVLFSGEPVPVKNPPAEPFSIALRATPNRYHRILYNSQCSHGVNTGLENKWTEKRGRLYPKAKNSLFCEAHSESYRVRRFYHEEHAKRNNVLNFSPGPAYGFFPHIQVGVYHRNSTGAKFGGAKRTVPRTGKSSELFEPSFPPRRSVSDWHDKDDEALWTVPKEPKWEEEMREKNMKVAADAKKKRKGGSRSWRAVIEAEKKGHLTERGTASTGRGGVHSEGSMGSLHRQNSVASLASRRSISGENSSIFLPPLSSVSGSVGPGSPRGTLVKKFVALEMPSKPSTFPYANAGDYDKPMTEKIASGPASPQMSTATSVK